ncbi:MAG: carboxymuconolactone decarboxylase family protein [Salinibacter sp.]|uniref:carboxymuconolactone decarboxylase family protein n=1 Tax=Salinibacter sp. TaxID=2065818 RepID=UPI0035D3DA85
METLQTDTAPTNNDDRSAEAGSTPRLAPIENPDSWRVWLAYKIMEWTEGTVITPTMVMQARLPESLRQAYETQKLEENLSLSPALRLLLKRYVAFLNGCAFCIDMAEADAEDRGVDVDKLRKVADYEASDRFSAAERAALAHAEAVTEDVHVDDATFETLRDPFSEREIVEVTWLCAAENYWNRISAPLNIGSDGLCSV